MSNSSTDKKAPLGSQPRSASTVVQINALRPEPKPYRVFCGDGLICVVTPRGMKTWFTRYTRNGRTTMERLGCLTHDEKMTLAEAREARVDVRKVVRAKGNPKFDRAQAVDKRATESARTFETCVREWHAKQAKLRGWSELYAKTMIRRFERHVFPAKIARGQTFGETPIRDLTRDHVIDVIENGMILASAYSRRSDLEPSERGKTMGNHLRAYLVEVFNEWLDRGWIEVNPAVRLNRRTKVPKRHRPAEDTILGARQVLAAIEGSPTAAVLVKLLNRFHALTGVRPSEARLAEWSEFDGGVWTIPAARMKGKAGQRAEHTVYLTTQALEVLAVLRALARRDAVHVFIHSRAETPMCDDAVSQAMRRALRGSGLRHVPHGWRAAFSTVMNAARPPDARVIDAMLAHKPRGNEVISRHEHGPYNRTDVTRFPQAATIAQEWADLLLEGAPSAWTLAGLPAPSAKIIKLRRAA